MRTGCISSFFLAASGVHAGCQHDHGHDHQDHQHHDHDKNPWTQSQVYDFKAGSYMMRVCPNKELGTMLMSMRFVKNVTEEAIKGAEAGAAKIFTSFSASRKELIHGEYFRLRESPLFRIKLSHEDVVFNAAMKGVPVAHAHNQAGGHHHHAHGHKHHHHHRRLHGSATEAACGGHGH